ncbi:protein FAR1-RELATED SEQUENCE 5-like [Nicotiana tabacum]|uniref:Protein FAR1-RELATED SEQUENCE 5-like n=1 Tax=Nicotiana tabacum TaxID=4097 RepID=A0AC58U2U8_TOBAC
MADDNRIELVDTGAQKQLSERDTSLVEEVRMLREYMTDMYQIPFSGCLKRFLERCLEKKPKTIFTDQDATMSKAISLVMPEVYHRLCVWHIEKNAAKHLNQIYKRYASFRGDFRKCIYEYEDEENFMDTWNTMIDEYNLHENEWLQEIYVLREKLFAPYRKKTFSGGMNITQLSESLSGDLKDYWQSDYNLVQLFKHYDRETEDK